MNICLKIIRFANCSCVPELCILLNACNRRQMGGVENIRSDTLNVRIAQQSSWSETKEQL